MIGTRRHADYATRIVLHLSMLGDGAGITAEEVAPETAFARGLRAQDCPAPGSSGNSEHNAGSGRRDFPGPPSEISLFDVVEAMEGGLMLNACVNNPEACPL